MSLKNRKKIVIDDSNIKLEVDNFDDSIFDGVFASNQSNNVSKTVDLSNNLVFCDLKRKNSTVNTSSTCSSRSSNTSDEEEDSEDEDEDEEEDEEEEEEDDEDEEEDEEEDEDYDSESIYSSVSSDGESNLECSIFNSSSIIFEKLENTLDALLEDEL